MAELDAFAQGSWGKKFPTVTAAWRRAWDRVIPFFAFPPPIRRVIYTTNAIESINARLRKIIKTRGHFPSDEAATKLQRLEGGHESIRRPLRRSLHSLCRIKLNQALLFGKVSVRLTHRNSDTPPDVYSSMISVVPKSAPSIA